MSKTDRAHIEGIVVAKSIDGEIVGSILWPHDLLRPCTAEVLS